MNVVFKNIISGIKHNLNDMEKSPIVIIDYKMEKILFYRYGNSGDYRNDYIFQDKEYLNNILNNAVKFCKEFSRSIANSYNITVDDYNKYILPNNIITCFYIEYYSTVYAKMISYIDTINIKVYIPDTIKRKNVINHYMGNNSCLFNITESDFDFKKIAYDVIVGTKDKNGILHEDCFQRRYIHTVTNHVN